MEPEILEKIKKYSKDEESFEKLKDLYDDLEKRYKEKSKHLDLLEAAIANDYDSIVITGLELEDPGPRIVYVNDGFCEMTGYSKEEVLGKTPRILQGPKTDEEVLKRLKERLENGQSFFGQTVNYRKDGSEFVNQWDIHPLTDGEGNITHWVSYQHDITERKRAETMLVDTQVEFDSLREESTRTVVDVSPEGDIKMANKAFRQLIGYGKDELNSIKIWDLFPKRYRSSLKSRFEGGLSLENFDNQHFKGIIKHRNDFPIQVEGRTKVMNLKDQTLIRADIKNVSLQKRIISELKKRNKDYSNIFQKASEFNYRVRMKDGEPTLEYVSEGFPEFTGLSPDSVMKDGGLEKLVHKDDLEEVKSHYQEICNGSSCTCEYRIRDINGDYIEIIDYGKPHYDNDNGDVVCAKGAISLKPSS